MQYWNIVLNEVLQKNDERSFFYTNRGRLEDSFSITPLIYLDKRPDRRIYYLNDPFENKYLTFREAQTLFWLIQDYTLAAAAHKMGLSSRTVEFYVKNMKMKLHCATKKEMVEKILQTNLLEQLEKDGLKILKH